MVNYPYLIPRLYGDQGVEDIYRFIDRRLLVTNPRGGQFTLGAAGGGVVRGRGGSRGEVYWGKGLGLLVRKMPRIVIVSCLETYPSAFQITPLVASLQLKGASTSAQFKLLLRDLCIRKSISIHI